MNALLQPEDSKRVADAVIREIEPFLHGLCNRVENALKESLAPDPRGKGFGSELIYAVGENVHGAVESCAGSKELGDIISAAIREGLDEALR